MTYTTRRLGPGDTQTATDLLHVFAVSFDDLGVYDKIPKSSYVESVLSEENTVVLVAEDESGLVAGGILAYILKKLEQEHSEIYLYDLAVHPQHRRRGVATALIDSLRDVARRNDATVIFVQADADDEAAIRLYSKLASEHITPHHFDILP